jgi:hypothetical protein
MTNPKKLYESMSDSSLIDLYCAFKLDYSRGRKNDDRKAIDLCEERLPIILDVLESRGRKP